MSSSNLRALAPLLCLLLLATTTRTASDTPATEPVNQKQTNPTTDPNRQLVVAPVTSDKQQIKKLASDFDEKASQPMIKSEAIHQKMFNQLESGVMSKAQYLEGNFFGVPIYSDDLAYLPDELKKKFEDQNKDFKRVLVKDVKKENSVKAVRAVFTWRFLGCVWI